MYMALAEAVDARLVTCDALPRPRGMLFGLNQSAHGPSCRRSASPLVPPCVAVESAPLSSGLTCFARRFSGRFKPEPSGFTGNGKQNDYWFVTVGAPEDVFSCIDSQLRVPSLDA
jgi:hypothetical protein